MTRNRRAHWAFEWRIGPLTAALSPSEGERESRWPDPSGKRGLLGKGTFLGGEAEEALALCAVQFLAVVRQGGENRVVFGVEGSDVSEGSG